MYFSTMMGTPTYTMDEVFDEAKRFATENGITITSKKGLPRGVCGDVHECVLANFFGEIVWFTDGRCAQSKENPETGKPYKYAVGDTLIDSHILETFVTQFDDRLYPELVTDSLGDDY